MTTRTPTALDFAREYTRRKYRTVPVPYRGKALYEDGWEDWRLDEADLPNHFNGHAQNVGVLMGEPSGGLIDADCDSPQSVALARVFLPATHSTFGHASKRLSHWLYKADPVKATVQFRDVGGKMIAEYRSTGCQTVMPGSTHEEGEPITWDEDGAPAAVDGGYLLDCVSKLAAASIIAAHWPAEGSRQAAALALAGGLLRADWEDTQVREFIEAVADVAGDSETRKRVSAAEYTRRRLEADKTATGWPALADLLGDKVVDKAREWLRVAKDANQHDPFVRKTAKGANPGVGTLSVGRVLLSEVTPVKLKRLWGGWIPLGKAGEMIGEAGLGKGTLLCDIAARITQHLPMPNEVLCDLDRARGVVWYTAEDMLADTLVPRLLAAGANLDRIVARQYVQDGEGERLPDLYRDMAHLEADIESVDAALVILDPVLCFFPHDANSYKEQDVRRVMGPLGLLADRTVASMMAVRHPNKDQSVGAINRGGGSTGFTAGARFSLVVGKDPADETGERRVIAVNKSNAFKEPTALGYRLVTDPQYDVGKVEWLGPVDYTANTLLGTTNNLLTGDELSKVQEAMAFLSKTLAEGPRKVDEVKKEATLLGFSERTLIRAKDRLGVAADKAGFGLGGYWTWALPARREEPAKDANDNVDGVPETPKDANGKVGILSSDAARPDFYRCMKLGKSLVDGVLVGRACGDCAVPCQGAVPCYAEGVEV